MWTIAKITQRSQRYHLTPWEIRENSAELRSQRYAQRSQRYFGHTAMTQNWSEILTQRASRAISLMESQPCATLPVAPPVPVAPATATIVALAETGESQVSDQVLAALARGLPFGDGPAAAVTVLVLVTIGEQVSAVEAGEWDRFVESITRHNLWARERAGASR